MKILVTGTPGTGKTTLASKLAKKLNIIHLDVTSFIKRHKLYSGYDGTLDTFIFSESQVSRALKKRLKGVKSFIIDTHSPKVAERLKINVIVLMRCAQKELRRRLTERGYSEAKIEENMECEICDVLMDDLDEYFSNTKPLVVQSSDGHVERGEVDTETAMKLLCNMATRKKHQTSSENIVNVEAARK